MKRTFSTRLWIAAHPRVWSFRNPLILAWDFYEQNELPLSVGFVSGFVLGVTAVIVMLAVQA